MSKIVEDALEFIDTLPKVNSATAYGSGFFKQNSGYDEKKSMDLILSVDNPSKWHLENNENNPEMYKGTGFKNMINPEELENDLYRTSFPKSISCFFTDFGDYEYKLLVTDKRLLYEDLKTWNYFSLAGRFQKENKLLIDNSDGVLPELMKQNFEAAGKTALLLDSSYLVSIEEYFSLITSLSYLGDLRNIFHCEDPNKIRNIVEGSNAFFREHYLFHGKMIHDNLFKDSGYSGEKLIGRVEELPLHLRSYLVSNLTTEELSNMLTVSKAIKKFFRNLDFISSTQLALRCRQTVGAEKTMQTFMGKAKKGMQKVKKK